MNQINGWEVIVLAENLKSSPAADLIATDLKHMLRTFCFIPTNNAVNIQFCLYTDFDLDELFCDMPVKITKNPNSTPKFTVLRLGRHDTGEVLGVSPDLVYVEGGHWVIQRLYSADTTCPWTEEHLSAAFSLCSQGTRFARTLILTFGHGDGFAVFGSGQALGTNSEFTLKGQSITMDEFASALKRGFAGRKVDLLLLQNCFMMTTDSLFALQKVVGYVVAPQTAICFYGYHYEAILQSIISTNGLISAQLLSSLAVSTISANPAYCKHNNWLQKLALFGADLEELQKSNYFELVQGLFALIVSHVSRSALLRVRQQIISPVFTASFLLSSGLIDLYAFFSQLEKEVNRPAYTDYLIQYKLAVWAMFGGEYPRIFKGSSLAVLPALHINGINCCIPLNPGQVTKGYFQRYYFEKPSAFARQSSLPQLVEYLYN